MKQIATADLTLGDVPSPDAPFQEILSFASSFNGYVGITGHQEIHALGGRWDEVGGASMSLTELRRVLFIKFRGDYHNGGYSDSPFRPQMRQLVREITERLQRPALEVWRGDITALEVDAIVNAANERMLGGSGVDGAIHAAAGTRLVEACRAIPEVRSGVRCPVGTARITPGFDLKAAFVIHTVGPMWSGGESGEPALLASAYRSALEVASGHGLRSVAFPAISTGVYGYPTDQAARVAVETVRACRSASGCPQRVVLVAFDGASERVLRSALEPDPRSDGAA